MTHASDEPYRGSFPNAGGAGESVFDNTKRQQSIGQLVADTPRLLIGLAKDEFEQGKRELVGKAKKLTVVIVLAVVALFFALTMWAVLVAAAVLGLNEAFAPWLSALIVAGAFLVLIIILAIAALVALKKALPLQPERTAASLGQDLNAVKGTGQYE